MKKMKEVFKHNFGSFAIVMVIVILLSPSCSKDDETETPEPPVNDSLTVSGPEDGLAIFINGIDTKETTPAKFSKDPGTYNVFVFSEANGKIYAQTVEMVEGEATQITFSDADISVRSWKCLVVGFKSVTDGVSTYTYTEDDITKASGMILNELEFAEEKTYGIMDWSLETVFVDETVDLEGGYVTPATFNSAYPDIEPGDFDLVVAVYQDGTDWGNWPAPEHSITAIAAKASFISIPYVSSANIDSDVAWWEENQAGFLMNPYLRTLTQEFYPSLGLTMPPDDGSGQEVVMWRAEQYGYNGDNNWVEWYEDILIANVDGKYGIGIEALFGMSVRANALGEIGD